METCTATSGYRGDNMQPTQQIEDQPLPPPNDGFAQVTKRNSAKKQSQNTAQPQAYELGNPFQALGTLMSLCSNNRENGGGEGTSNG